MSDEMNVKISDIKAGFIKDAAKFVDEKFGNNDKSINEKEAELLRTYLNGDIAKKKNQKKLGKESDEVKAIFGLNISTPAEKTQAAPVAQPAADKANEAAQKNAAYDEVKARFLEALGYDEEKNTTTTTIEKAYKQVKKEFKGKDKEYKEALEKLEDYANHEFANKLAQRTRASVQAYDSEGHLVNADNLQYNSSKKVKKRNKELVKENLNGDKRVKKALRNNNTSLIKRFGRWISGNSSAGKVDDKAVAGGNRAVNIRENVTFTQESITDALGKKNPLVQPYTDKNGKTYDNILVATGLITQTSNGEYVVKNLSKVVGEAVGADNTLNDHNNHNESELQAVLTKLYQAMRANGSGDFKTSELSDKEVRKLVKFLGYESDRAQLMAVRMWQHLWKGVGAGAAAGAAAGAMNGSWAVDIKQHQEVNLSLEGFSEQSKADFINALKAENSLSDIPVSANYGSGLVETTIGNITETALGIYIAQDQMINGTIVPLLKSIAMGALAGAGVGAAVGVIEGLLSEAQEKEVLGMLFDCDSTYEEILDTIDNAYSDKNLKPELKTALKEIAKLGIVTTIDPKTGARKAVLDKDCNTQWDFCLFIENYNKIRGNQILNAAEVRAAARTLDKHQIEVPDCEPQQPVVEIEECTDCTPKVGDKGYKIPPHAWERQGGETWLAIVKAKYPCLVEELAKAGIDVYSKDGAIKVMQRELATDEDGVFHADKYKGITGGDIPKHLDFPDEITITVKGKTITCKYEDNDVERVSQKKLGSGVKTNSGRYGYGRKGNNKTYTDDCHPAIVGEGKTEAEAKADFDRKVKEAK